MSDETKIPPRKKIEKPLNPLAAKPGQKYDKPSFVPTKEYDGGKLATDDKTKGGIDVVAEAAKQKEKA
jgi:hypothetical protein